MVALLHLHITLLCLLALISFFFFRMSLCLGTCIAENLTVQYRSLPLSLLLPLSPLLPLRTRKQHPQGRERVRCYPFMTDYRNNKHA